jgi:hypothetical protein
MLLVSLGSLLEVLNVPYVHLRAERWLPDPPHLHDARQFVVTTGTKSRGWMETLLEMIALPLWPLPLNRPL